MTPQSEDESSEDFASPEDVVVSPNSQQDSSEKNASPPVAKFWEESKEEPDSMKVQIETKQPETSGEKAGLST